MPEFELVPKITLDRETRKQVLNKLSSWDESDSQTLMRLKDTFKVHDESPHSVMTIVLELKP